MIKQSLILLLSIIYSSNSLAIEGLELLEKKLFESNQEIQSLQKDSESKEALLNSAKAVFFPTLSAVGGYSKNRTDEKPMEMGYSGYLEGKMNFFKGFKDQSIYAQRNIDFQISKIELEQRKRRLKLEITEIASDMILLHNLQTILDDEIKVTKTQRQMAAKKVAAGLTGVTDNYEIDLRESEIQIEQTQINQKHLEAHHNLSKLIGSDIKDEDLEKLEFSRINQLMTLPDKIKIENTLEFQRATLFESKAQEEIKEARADCLPSVDFTYSFGRLTPNEDSQLKLNESKYGLMVTIPLFSGFETHYKTKSIVSKTQALASLKTQSINDLNAELLTLRSKNDELKSLFHINEKKLVSSQKYFDLTLAEYKRGIKNSPDVVGATERLFSSKKKKFEILKDLELIKGKMETLILQNPF